MRSAPGRERGDGHDLRPHASKLAVVADDITAAGGRVHQVVADVTAEADVERLVAEAVDTFGALHGVVANAGGGGALGAVPPDGCG